MVNLVGIFVCPILLVAFLLLENLHLLKLSWIHLFISSLLDWLQCLLQSEHFIAYVVAYLNRTSLFELEFFPASVLKYLLA